MMTVKELIEALQKVDQTRIVILQKDGEGNGYSPIAGIDDNTVYEAETTYSGEVRIHHLTDALIEQGFSDEDVGDGQPCLVLYPIN